ncbi:MAG: rod shape-determining protein MreC [Aquificaceae bacterium]
MKRHAFRLAIFLIAIAIYQLQVSTIPVIGKLYWIINEISMPLNELKGTLQSKARAVLDKYILLQNVQRENAALKSKILELSAISAELRACKHELKILNEYTGLRVEYPKVSAIPARVLGYDPLGQDRFVLIDRGISQGVEKGALVIVGEELLGIVEQVFAQSARVKTLYSSDFSISASLEGKAYIYRGGFPFGSLLFVRSEDNIQKGQEVTLRAEGLSGLRIGYVVSVGPDSGQFFKSVSVKPALDVRRTKTCTVLRRQL